MKKILLILMALATSVCADATCGYCKGNGRVRTHVGMSTYGVSNEKFKCQYCGEWVLKSCDHWDPCPYCQGNPGSVGHQSRQSSRDDRVVSDPNIRYLSSAEYSDWRNCIDLAMRGGIKMVDCPDCQGDGKCRMCGGSGRAPFQDPADMEFLGMPTPCPRCGQSGNCLRCNGSRQISVTDESVKVMANQRLEYYRDLVNQRMQADNGNNSYQPSYASGGYDYGYDDSEGREYLEEYGYVDEYDYSQENGYYEENGYDEYGDGSYTGNDYSGSAKSKEKKDNTIIGAVACMCIAVFFYIRHRRRRRKSRDQQ